MSKKFLFVFLLFCSSSLFAAPMNSDWLRIEWIDTRISGHHSINLETDLPDTGDNCDLLDRGVIADAISPAIQGGTAMLDAALMALSGDKLVLLRVDGCALIHPTESTLTAPKVVRVSVCNDQVMGSLCNP